MTEDVSSSKRVVSLLIAVTVAVGFTVFAAGGVVAGDETEDDDLIPDPEEVEFAEICVAGGEDPFGQPQEPVCVSPDDVTPENNGMSVAQSDDICVGPSTDPFGQPQEPICIISVVDSVGDSLNGQTAVTATPDGICVAGVEDPWGQPKEPICIDL